MDASQTKITDQTSKPQQIDQSDRGGKKVAETESGNMMADVAMKIIESHNVLVALSSDPSVDEMATAIGLTLFLDRLGKKTTTIYSGATPNALEFLKPEEMFEESVDVLQDFVVALNKEKADHLRYKLDGEYVKIYITPYKKRISSEDLEFSYGDFNVDLVLAIDVANGIDLDAALREHGRIMHDATIINITTGKPGKFGEVEWSDLKASSVSEMVAKLAYSIDDKKVIQSEEATAFLTGIVAATNRFSNARTTAETMKVASKLMESGANQQLVSKNITVEVENELFGLARMKSGKGEEKEVLNIKHGAETEDEGEIEGKDNEFEVRQKEVGEEREITVEGDEQSKDETATDLMDELKKAEKNLVEAGAEAVSIEQQSTGEDEKNQMNEEGKDSEGSKEVEASKSETENVMVNGRSEKVIQPLGENGLVASGGVEDTDKYSRMLEEALEEPEEEGEEEETESAVEMPPVVNPAVAKAPIVVSQPEVNGVPEINYMPMPGDEILPPPPTPPLDISKLSKPDISPVVVQPSLPVEKIEQPKVEEVKNEVPSEVQSVVVPPIVSDQNHTPQANDPGSFKIPGV